MTIDDERPWHQDTAFHEFGPATLDARGSDGDAYRVFAVGGRGATKAQEARDEGADEPTVLLLSTSLGGATDGPPMRILADDARKMAHALLRAADDADREYAAGGRTVDAIMQGLARAWRRSLRPAG